MISCRANSCVFKEFLYFMAVIIIFLFSWSGNVYGGTQPGFTWKIEVVHPAPADTADSKMAERARDVMFSEIANSLSSVGVETGYEKFRSEQGDIYRLRSLTKTSLEDFRRQFHGKIRQKIPFLSGPVRMSVAGKMAATGRFTVVVDSNPSTGYHWKLDSSSGAQIVFEKHDFEMRSFKRGAVQSQTLILTANQAGPAQFDLVYRRPWRQQDSEKVILTLETEDTLPATLDISDPYAVKESISTSSLSTSRNAARKTDDTTALPTSFDWRTYDVVPAVRNQGGCGSCFAFGTVGVMESALKIYGWPLTDLSEQFLVSCNNDGWNCDTGGFTAHKYHYDTLGTNQTAIGAVLEADMPYTETNGSCTNAYNHPYILASWAFVPADEFTLTPVADIKNAIYNYGPITAGVCAGDEFSDYESGIFSTDETASACGGGTNHQIILVGWNDNNGVDVDGYWILRNSWDSSWGESGYMRIKYGTSRVGEGTSYVTIAACPNNPVNISGTSNYYPIVQIAYSDASSGQTLLLQEKAFAENLSFTQNKTITLIGGYDCYYSSNSGTFSTVSGSLTIGGSGVITMDQIIIK